MIRVNEIFESLQGESTYSGFPCHFIRLTGCNLRCSWCDTKYSYADGTLYHSEELIELINSSHLDIVEFTGGEPLLQKDELIKIISNIDPAKTVLLETNGSISLRDIPERVIKIVDIKLKSSGESGTFLLENLEFIQKKDEIKFVLNDIFDYNEFRSIYFDYGLQSKGTILVSRTGCSGLKDKDIAEMILADKLNVKYQIQLHKHIWNNERGR